MPLTYSLAEGIIDVVATGEVDFHAGLAVLGRAFAAAAAVAPTGWHLVIDITRSEENRTSEELRGIVEVVREHRPLLSGRCAVVASDALHYGLGRMFQTYMDGAGAVVAIFEGMEEAREWVVRGDVPD